MKQKITIDTHIRISNLTREWRLGLARLCSVDNEQKEAAINEHVWGAHKMDDLITLADISDEEMILPRGFLSELKKLLPEVEVVDNTSDANESVSWEKSPKYKDYQAKSIAQIISKASGRIIAPPGKGKTVIGLGAASELQKPTLILVAQKHLAKQWQDRAKQHFNKELGFIGDNKWQEEPVTVALIQTLWSRRDKLDKEKWWDKWSVVILDEQHHVPAESFYEIISKFPAKYRIGLSATIGKSDAKKKISELVFGPILYEIKETAIDPQIKVVNTDFEFDYYPTQKINGRVVRNNYHKLIEKLASDERRNALIAKYVVENQNNCNLVFSRRLAQLATIKSYVIEFGFPEDRCWDLTGAESIEERMEIYEKADGGNCAIFSTIADEGLDIPRLDRGYLAFPVKNEEIIKQQLGRVSREHIDKKDAIVYDIVDRKVPVLKKQYGNRLRKHYQRNKLSVSIEYD
jgi:superfamily II DNA or RNA helicase